MSSKNYYDVTKWNVGNPYEDIGEVINSIIADIKKRQTDSNMNEGGKPEAERLHFLRQCRNISPGTKD